MNREIEILKRIFSDVCINDTLDSICEGERMKRQIRHATVNDEDMLVLRLDRNDRGLDPFPYLRCSVDGGYEGIKRICDYVIFVSFEKVLFVLLIEMKIGNESPREQLTQSELLIHFVFQRARKVGVSGLGNNVIIRKIGVSDAAGRRDTLNRGEVRYDKDGFAKLYHAKSLCLEYLLH